MYNKILLISKPCKILDSFGIITSSLVIDRIEQNHNRAYYNTNKWTNRYKKLNSDCNAVVLIALIGFEVDQTII